MDKLDKKADEVEKANTDGWISIEDSAKEAEGKVEGVVDKKGDATSEAWNAIEDSAKQVAGDLEQAAQAGCQATENAAEQVQQDVSKAAGDEWSSEEPKPVPDDGNRWAGEIVTPQVPVADSTQPDPNRSAPGTVEYSQPSGGSYVPPVSTSPVPAKSKFPTWAIILIVVLLLCICVICPLVLIPTITSFMEQAFEIAIHMV
ncbi:MAG: hypothetical protein ACOYKD_01035 [Anaerolineaceae bacterium]|jgi:hypothetical protein